jgi:hypothetical protein
MPRRRGLNLALGERHLSEPKADCVHGFGRVWAIPPSQHGPKILRGRHRQPLAKELPKVTEVLSASFTDRGIRDRASLQEAHFKHGPANLLQVRSFAILEDGQPLPKWESGNGSTLGDALLAPCAAFLLPRPGTAANRFRFHATPSNFTTTPPDAPGRIPK